MNRRTMAKTNIVPIRDKRGRYLKGMPGGPAGRSDCATSCARTASPTCTLLGWSPEVIDRLIAERPERFLLAMLKITQVHRVEFGRPEELYPLIAERPEVFLLAMLKITQVHRVELGQPEELYPPSSKEEALQRLEKRAGPKPRKMLEDFLAKVAKLERSRHFDEAG